MIAHKKILNIMHRKKANYNGLLHNPRLKLKNSVGIFFSIWLYTILENNILVLFVLDWPILCMSCRIPFMSDHFYNFKNSLTLLIFKTGSITFKKPVGHH